MNTTNPYVTEGNSKRESDNVRRAKEILRSSGKRVPLTDLAALAEGLKNEKAVGYARRILHRACLDPGLAQDPRLRTRLIQQHALCTYKDPDLPLQSKFDRALIILAQLGDLRTLEQLGDMPQPSNRGKKR